MSSMQSPITAPHFYQWPSSDFQHSGVAFHSCDVHGMFGMEQMVGNAAQAPAIKPENVWQESTDLGDSGMKVCRMTERHGMIAPRPTISRQ